MVAVHRTREYTVGTLRPDREGPGMLETDVLEEGCRTEMQCANRGQRRGAVAGRF